MKGALILVISGFSLARCPRSFEPSICRVWRACSLSNCPLVVRDENEAEIYARRNSITV